MPSMNDEFADIWQEQHTRGTVTSVDEIRARAVRLKKRVDLLRRGGVLTWLLLLATVVVDLLFFEDRLMPWLYAIRYVLYTFVIISTPLILRKKATPRTTESRILTLNMLAMSTPCLEFYRKELEYRAEDLKNGRTVAPFMVFLGLGFALVRTPSQKNPWPAILAGSIVAMSSFVWYVRMRREAPRVRVELEDLDASIPKSDREDGT